MTVPVNMIRVRVFEERGLHFITGVQLCYMDRSEQSQVLADLNLHDFGSWCEHRMEEGDQIIGMYGLHNNLIRSIGFIMMNMKPPESFFNQLKSNVPSSSVVKKVSAAPSQALQDDNEEDITCYAQDVV